MDAPEQKTAPPRRTGTRWAAVGGLGAAAVLSTVLLTDPWGAEESDTGSPAATATSPMEAASAAPPTTAATTDAPSAAASSDRPAAAAPLRLAVEDAQLDVTVLPLTPSEQELATELLVPPDTLDGYWLTPYGMPGEGSENTTYITGHSWEDRDAPFNRLSNPGLVGSEIELETGTGTLEYVVDSVVTHDKNTLKDSDIWRIVPDRLVIVSCYTDDLWGKNVVLTASPAPA
ncbi:class F sortase [Kocuria nitroreducens]|uniref:class F sortase n=1 Tax=Kocuria nitroreducens TaxID=3058914 RepID=UPI0036DD8136